MLLRNILKLFLIVTAIGPADKLEAAASAEPSQNTEQTFFAALNEGNAPYAAQILRTMSQYYSTERLGPLIRRFVQQLFRTPLSTEQKLAIAQSIGTMHEFQDSPVLQWLRVVGEDLQDELQHEIERRYGFTVRVAPTAETAPTAIPEESASQELRQLFIKAVNDKNWPLAINYFASIEKTLTDQSTAFGPEEINQLKQRSFLYSGFLISNIVHSNLSKFDKNTLQTALKNILSPYPLKTWLENFTPSLSYEERKAILIRYYPHNSDFAESLAREPLQAENLPKITLPKPNVATKTHSSSRQGVPSLKELALNSLQADTPRPWQPTRRLTPSTDSSPIPSQASPRELAALASELLRSEAPEITKQRVAEIIDTLDVSDEIKNSLFDPLAQELAKQYYLRELKRNPKYRITYLPYFLRQNFTGLSIQDYLDNDIQCAKWDPAQLSLVITKEINNFKGLNNIPHVHEAQTIFINRAFLPTLPAGAIADLPNLQNLILTENSIERIEGGAFRNLPNLTLLNLTKNFLTHLPAGLFTMLPTLRMIDLNGNRFSAQEQERIMEEAQRVSPGIEIAFQYALTKLAPPTVHVKMQKSLGDLALLALDELYSKIAKAVANIIEKKIEHDFANNPKLSLYIIQRGPDMALVEPPLIGKIFSVIPQPNLNKYWTPNQINKETLTYLQNNRLSAYNTMLDQLSNLVKATLAKHYHLYCTAYGCKSRNVPLPLREYFTGVSIQDIIDLGLLPQFRGLEYNLFTSPRKADSLNLAPFLVNSLKGLQNIPDLKNLFRLDISSASFAKLPANSFVGFQALRQLTIKHNSPTTIDRIDKNAFNGLDNLTILELHDHGLTSLDLNVFAPLRKLQILNLVGNKFSEAERARIRAEIPTVLPNLRKLLL